LKVRAASIRDLAGVEQLYTQSGEQSGVAPPAARLWSLVSHTMSALLPLYLETLLFVAEEGGRLIGFIQASARPPGINLPVATSLQVLNVCVADGVDPEEVAPALVDHLCNQALLRGVRRLFVRLPIDDPLIAVFRMQGFRQYASEHLLYSESPAVLREGEVDGLRSPRGRDVALLYQLYRKVTPMRVAQVEAPTLKEWRAMRIKADQQLVLDRIELLGWLHVQRGSSTSPHTLSFLALPEDPVPDELADHAIQLLESRPGPVWSSLRHYDSHMIDALRGRGFSTLLTQSLMVKELAVRVPLPEKGLVPSFG
jgi:hypothetical protein